MLFDFFLKMAAAKMDAILADINGNDTDLSKLITDVIQKRAKAVMDRKIQFFISFLFKVYKIFLRQK
uniref:WSSV051 n=1 Tax=White spot syndrome virus TaxID=342409 RepID=A0A3G5BHP7_9VIRU|nr:WSSV051 [White spot syndrome virus]